MRDRISHHVILLIVYGSGRDTDIQRAAENKNRSSITCNIFMIVYCVIALQNVRVHFGRNTGSVYNIPKHGVDIYHPRLFDHSFRNIIIINTVTIYYIIGVIC